jgi:hypothetical protein
MFSMLYKKKMEFFPLREISNIRVNSFRTNIKVLILFKLIIIQFIQKLFGLFDEYFVFYRSLPKRFFICLGN